MPDKSDIWVEKRHVGQILPARISGVTDQPPEWGMTVDYVVTFRSGEPRDCSDIAILADAASRRITSWLWGQSASPGQSWVEYGRNRVLTATTAAIFHENWQMVQIDGQLAGGCFGFLIPDPYDPGDLSDVPDFVRPLITMEEVAKGCWMLQCIAVFPEQRGKGLGRRLIDMACETAQTSGARRIVLEVENVNAGAIGLYTASGFTEWMRCPYVPFPGSDDTGDWILMVRDL